MRTFSLTSFGVKLFSIVTSIMCVVLFIIILVWRNQIPWFAICIVSIITCVQIFCNVCLIKHKLIINSNKHKLIIGGGKKLIGNIPIDIEEIVTIEVIKDMIDSKRFATIMIYLKNGKRYNTLGFYSLLHRNDMQVTMNIVERIKQEIINTRSK